MAGLSIAVVKAASVTTALSLPDPERVVSDSSLLRLAENAAEADLRVEVYPEDVFRFYRQQDIAAVAVVRIPVKKGQALPRKLQSLLEHIAAYSHLKELVAPLPVLRDCVKAEFLKLEQPARRDQPPECSPLPVNSAGELVFRSGDNLVIQVTHTSPTPVYVYSVAMDTRRLGVSLVYPYSPDQSAKVAPGETLIIGAGPVFTVELQLPADEKNSLELFKVFVSQTAIDPKVMVMPPLGQRQEVSRDPYGAGSRLDRDLRQRILGLTGMTSIPDFTRDPWWCLQQPIRIVSPVE